MANTPEEDLLGWLLREEETLGMDSTVRASTDVDYAFALLREELGYDPTEEQLGAFMEVGRTNYEVLPKINIVFSSVEQKWGTQYVYRDAGTGRFVSSEDVQKRIEGLG